MIRHEVIDRLVHLTIRQFADDYGRRPGDFNEFADFISDYSATAWKNDYVRHGGARGLNADPDDVEAAVHERARELFGAPPESFQSWRERLARRRQRSGPATGPLIEGTAVRLTGF